MIEVGIIVVCRSGAIGLVARFGWHRFMLPKFEIWSALESESEAQALASMTSGYCRLLSVTSQLRLSVTFSSFKLRNFRLRALHNILSLLLNTRQRDTRVSTSSSHLPLLVLAHQTGLRTSKHELIEGRRLNWVFSNRRHLKYVV